MLMTPMTPNVIASPMATSTSTDPRLRPKNSVSMPRVERARLIDAAHRRRPRRCRTAASASAKLPSGDCLEQRREPVAHFRPDAVARASRSPSRRASASPLVERGERQPGLDLAPSRAASVSTPTRSRSSAMLASSSERSISCHRVEPHRRVGARQREARHGRPQHSSQAVVRADLGQVVAGGGAGVLAATADRRARATASVVVGRLDDEDLLVGVADVEPIFEQRRQHGAHARMAGLRRAGRRSLPCRRSWPRAAPPSAARNRRPADCASAGRRRTAASSTRRAASRTRQRCRLDRGRLRRVRSRSGTVTCSSVPSTPWSSCCSSRT